MSRLLLNGPLLRFLTLLLNGLLPLLLTGLLPLLGYLLNSPLIGGLRAHSFPGCAAGDLPLLRGLRIAAHGRLAIGVFPRGLHDGFSLMVRTRNDGTGLACCIGKHGFRLLARLGEDGLCLRIRPVHGCARLVLHAPRRGIGHGLLARLQLLPGSARTGGELIAHALDFAQVVVRGALHGLEIAVRLQGELGDRADLRCAGHGRFRRKSIPELGVFRLDCIVLFRELHHELEQIKSAEMLQTFIHIAAFLLWYHG